ncbi:MAG TPA: S41 family peptidase [Candidatus Limnocylindrales bacterium]|nr:S41 family peptidase [Candidatus Limnocylindrales bacterium]
MQPDPNQPITAEPVATEPAPATDAATEPAPASDAAPSAGLRRLGPASLVRPALLVGALAVVFAAGFGVGRLDPTAAPWPGAAAASPSAAATPDPSTDEDDLALIREAWEAIQEHYVEADELDDRDLAYAAIDGLAEAVGDTGHTGFMTPEERATRTSALSGSYVGIGAQVGVSEDGLPMIIGVFRGSPADEAGLRSGDVVVAVDGEPTAGEDLDDVVERVRGEVGTAVVLTIRPGGDGSERDVQIVRADVQIEPVSWALVPGTKTAVLRLEQFSSGAAADLRAALADVRVAGADRLILDLRANPGGYVNEAVAAASEFLASGTVYVERNADGEEKPTAVTPDGTALDRPLVVLVDAASASAAEIVAGAIQDAGRARIVGEQTFGTGTVLGEFGLADGSALRIGTVEWLTPNGRVIWHEGIAPDIEVARPDGVLPVVPDDLRELMPADVAELADPQLARAIELVGDLP